MNTMCDHDRCRAKACKCSCHVRTLHDELRVDKEYEAGIQAATRTLRGENASLREEIDKLTKELGLHRRLKSEPIRPVQWPRKGRKKGARIGTLVAQLTDLHLDEVVVPGEIMGLNAYNRSIAIQRLARWVDKVVSLPREYMTGIEIEGLWIPATGDILSGDIHEELRRSNEDQLLSSTMFWIEQMIGILETLSLEFPRVRVDAVVGNHGRLSERPIFKGRAHDNVEWLLWSVVRDRLNDRGSSVEVYVSDGMDLNVPLYGRNHLLTHGDQFKGGTGISGAFAPLSLGAHRKTRRQMAAGLPMETMVIGHLHQLINIPGVIMGGCMKGYDEFAFGHNLPPDPNGSSQAMWVTTPERGQTIWMPCYLTDKEAEGWS